jgi:hypothetical protein
MMIGAQGFTTLDQAAVAIVAHTPHRTRPVNYEGLKKMLRQRDERHLVEVSESESMRLRCKGSSFCCIDSGAGPFREG